MRLAVFSTMLVAAMGASAAHAESDLTISLAGGTEMEFVWVEPGVFTMGVTQEQIDLFDAHDEAQLGEALLAAVPAHEVTITQGFYLGRTEVTHGQWKAVMGEDRGYPDDLPVDVPWVEMQAFIGRLNDAAGDSLYRLPTEAEWEYSCRAGTTSLWSLFADKDLISFGGNVLHLSSAVRVPEYQVGATTVAQYPPNPWGFYDMHGNMQEWVQDFFGQYSGQAQVDPTGPSSGSARVYRGGSTFIGEFMLPPSRTASAAREASGSASSGARILRLAVPLNRPPHADAGPDQIARLGDSFRLDASASRDPDGASLTYIWSEDPGNPDIGLLQDQTSSLIEVTPNAPGDYRFFVVVGDGRDTATDTTEIRVAPLAVSQPDAPVLAVDLWGSEPQDFVWIESGTFTMGLTSQQEDYLRSIGEWGNWKDGVQQVHSVTITHGFYMARHEITRRQWFGAMGSEPWGTDPHTSAPLDDRPATGMSWHDVQVFIALQNRAVGAEVFRLPTEAEWNFAYKAGTTTIWPWGDSPAAEGQYGWRVGDLHSVGMKPANDWGLFDMTGNAAEWCHDSFQLFSNSPVTDPVGTGSDQKMICGYHKRAQRFSADPDYVNLDVGFRLIAWGPDLTSGVESGSWGAFKKALQDR